MTRYKAQDFGTRERDRADRIQKEYLKCVEKLAMIEYMLYFLCFILAGFFGAILVDFLAS